MDYSLLRQRIPIIMMLLLASVPPSPMLLPVSATYCRRPAGQLQLQALLESALDGSNITMATSRVRVVRLSLTGLAVIGLNDGSGLRSSSGSSSVLQWSGSFLLAWNETRKSHRKGRRNATVQDGEAATAAAAAADWTPEIGVESESTLASNYSMADLWGRRHASVRSVRPNGEVTLRFRAALRTRCRVPPGSPGFPFDTRRCDLRLGRQQRSGGKGQRRLKLMLNNASLLVAASSSRWSVTGVRVVRRRRKRQKIRLAASDDYDDDVFGDGGQLFRLELARALAYYWLLAALPLVTTVTAAAVAVLALRVAGSRESGQRCLDCGCVILGCCLLLLGQGSAVYFSAGADSRGLADGPGLRLF